MTDQRLIVASVGLAADHRAAIARAVERRGDHEPVFVDESLIPGLSTEFSHRVLWPLLHNLPAPRRFSSQAWEEYQAANEAFADRVAALARPGDAIWIHDYPLALVPHILRRRGVDASIGYFLHAPFPASETFRTLPVREAILRGILGANLIGFHAYEYVGHFRSAALRILGVESEIDRLVLSLPTHSARLVALPIGVEPDEIAAIAATAEVEDEYRRLCREYDGKQVVLGVNCVNATKGLAEKFLAFQELLERHPALRHRTVLIQVATPPPAGVAENAELKRDLDELVGRVSGQFGSIDSSPVVYIHRELSRAELVALYRRADVALVTPVRDGMNLVCLEYIAARGDRPGTLVLSEFTGAAHCLSGAVLVNPHDPSGVADALAEALVAGPPGRETFEPMLEFVRSDTASRWAERFLTALGETTAELTSASVRLRVSAGPVRDAAARSRRRLLLLDYDGTLVPHVRLPENAAPSGPVRELLRRLAAQARVYVISGRSAAVLDDWLGDLPIGLVCEHGLAIREPEQAWSPQAQLPGMELSEIVLPVFRDFMARTPGSRIEHKAASFAWHYRGSDPKLGAWRAKELRLLLESQLVGHPYAVLVGSKVIEVRHVQVTKGHAAMTLLERHPEADFVLCAGNDRTDVNMFEALARSGRQGGVACQVGTVQAGADYHVETPGNLLAELRQLAELWEGLSS